MTVTEVFLGTLAVGSGVVICGFAAAVLREVAKQWQGAIKDARAAWRRYACRDMIIRAYYEPEKMCHVREWEMPEPYMVEMAKKAQKK